MLNGEIADILNMTARLMELHGENSFKARSYQSAAFRIDKMNEHLQGKTEAELAATEGIGQSISRKLHQLLETGTFPELETLCRNTPPGVMEMMQIKGIGPKKVAVLWKELGVESPGELLYACNENRLLSLKGFGAKTQELIIKSIEFKNAAKGQFLYPDAEVVAEELIEEIQKNKQVTSVHPGGEYRRKCEIITSLEFIITPASSIVNIQQLLIDLHMDPVLMTGEFQQLKSITREGIPVHFHFCDSAQLVKLRWLSTGAPLHLSRLQILNPDWNKHLESSADEPDFYKRCGFHYVIPEMREGEHALIPFSEPDRNPAVELKDLQGILHNHSTWSDGANTLEEMAMGCRNLKKTYFGICDHSRSAVYASGLTIERVQAQHAEIDALNHKMNPFVIFKGIESDILNNGSLDYPDEILASFDFIVASIHSGFRMDQQKATDRLIKAIHNPYTTILGHCTGRLLLSRPGYPIDHKAIIDACADAGVILELNAHPYRLDVDWHWIDYALSKNVMISINPDAHSVEGFEDLEYGVNAARKGGLYAGMTFNAQSLEFVQNWFLARRKKAKGG